MAETGRPQPLRSLRFRHTWRPEQNRVLEAVRLHLADHRLHVVAAPGAGKTTLGLECVRLLGRPALVLSPTRTIRDQWIERLRDFVPEGEPWPPSWVSRSLDAPGALTSVTYQALHTRHRRGDAPTAADTAEDAEADAEAEALETAPEARAIDALAATLAEAGVGTLVLDEAHHLRAEWWTALLALQERLDGVRTISLTATPPYDAEGHEWKRYEELCGPIDEEISVPELVKSGTLCPHQDFVWTVVPTERESEALVEYELRVVTVLRELSEDAVFLGALEAHAWLADGQGTPTPEADAVFGDPELAVALLVVLRGLGRPLPRPLLALLDVDGEGLPALTRDHWQTVLRSYLWPKAAAGGWPASEEVQAHREELARRLRREDLLWGRELRLAASRIAKRHLTQSVAKIAACESVLRLEHELRGDALRAVVLTDYIRDHDLGADGPRETETLGAWPIHRRLIERLPEALAGRAALLTGRATVVPAALGDELRALAPGESLALEPLAGRPGHTRVRGAPTGVLVAALTRLLERGSLRVLVGTRSLLGEGWDAPCLNALVLASSVGSFMLTNQMRGRAIRVDRGAPDKVASIWHLLAIGLDRPRTLVGAALEGGVFAPGLADLNELQGRFKTFVGLSDDGGRIENDLGRLDLPFLKRTRDSVTGASQLAPRPTFFRNAESLEAANREAEARRRALDRVRAGWKAAIDAATLGRVVPTVATAKPPRVIGAHVRGTLVRLLLTALMGFLGVFSSTIGGGRGGDGVSRLVVLAALAAFLSTLPGLFRAALLFFRHLPVDGTLHQMGLAVRDALCAAELIETDARRLRVKSSSLAGEAWVRLEGGSYQEQSLFADCVHELVGEVDNPRYLIVRSDRTLGYERRDYHPVPLVLGVRKERASLLHLAWRRRVGPGELIYTRAPENRGVLLKARARSFATAARRAAQRLDRWT